MNTQSRLSTILLLFIITASYISGGNAIADDKLLIGDVEAGRLIYMQGLSAGNYPIQATTSHDVKMSGSGFACVNCHRPSGMGSSEGGKYVLPVTGPILFAPRELNRNRIFSKLFHEIRPPEFVTRMRQARMRPAYTVDTLATAIRDGIDPAGSSFDPIMPRYDMSDDDMANLIAYLKSLSIKHDVGIDSKTAHFATIINDSTDTAARDAVLRAIQGYFDRFNLSIANDSSKGNFSPNYHSDFVKTYRDWTLHVWTLHGPPDTWNEQLMRLYKVQPVFAVAGGLINGPWSPVAQFCDKEKIPCLFPNTELPKTADAENAYSFHFTRGLELEAEVLAIYLEKQPSPPQRIVQISFADPYGEIPANVFTKAVNRWVSGSQLESVSVLNTETFIEEISRINTRHRDIDALVIWPGEHVSEVVTALQKHPPKIDVVTMPSNALDEWRKQHIQANNEGFLFSYPYELPTAYHPRAFLVHAWMRSNHIEVTHPTLQFQTYYMLTLLDYGMRNLLGDFYRDYFIEIIENEAESNLNNGTHPTLGLGPGQRFASKGGYVVVPDTKQGLRSVSKWIIP